jgi:hypothetical protein
LWEYRLFFFVTVIVPFLLMGSIGLVAAYLSAQVLGRAIVLRLIADLNGSTAHEPVITQYARYVASDQRIDRENRLVLVLQLRPTRFLPELIELTAPKWSKSGALCFRHPTYFIQFLSQSNRWQLGSESEMWS